MKKWLEFKTIEDFFHYSDSNGLTEEDIKGIKILLDKGDLND